MENQIVITVIGNDPFDPTILQEYVCHKKVRAAEIEGVSLTGELHLKDLGFLLMPREWLDKHNPEVGGYLVAYSLALIDNADLRIDGYLSYSPKKAFEDRYAKT